LGPKLLRKGMDFSVQIPHPSHLTYAKLCECEEYQAYTMV